MKQKIPVRSLSYDSRIYNYNPSVVKSKGVFSKYLDKNVFETH
jgi:hypothetical protein